ncbi:hypothetical protein F2P81_016233 [Scophthalmus maximus]|uniref:Uncharacterized protein n=1 Tax=Scophthalmus maximus TaxID=52904 RepID=A0A6A4SHJ1_SCOMX|nr:hypothetical protein F2P81_016233 [Scophthalmus maximus]
MLLMSVSRVNRLKRTLEFKTLNRMEPIVLICGCRFSRNFETVSEDSPNRYVYSVQCSHGILYQPWKLTNHPRRNDTEWTNTLYSAEKVGVNMTEEYDFDLSFNI